MSMDEVRVNIPSKTELHDKEDELVTLPSQEQTGRDTVNGSSKEKVEHGTSPPQDLTNKLGRDTEIASENGSSKEKVVHGTSPPQDLADGRSIMIDYYWGLYYRCLCHDDWDGAYEFLKNDPLKNFKYFIVTKLQSLRYKIVKGDTALHITVKQNYSNCLRGLVNVIEKDDLAIKNDDGNTAFFIAAATGRLPFAKVMFIKNEELPSIRGKNEMLPIHMAAQEGHKEMVKFLHRVTKDKITKEDRIKLLRILITTTGLYGPGINSLPKKEQPPPADELLELLLNKVDFRDSWITEFAVGQETVEFLILIIRLHPDLICKFHGDICGEILRNVVLQRRKGIFKLLVNNLTPSFKKTIVQYNDPEGNNFLHLAGKLAPSDQLDNISGVALQLQHELWWFKEVNNYVNPWDAKAKNGKGDTPKAFFNKEHEKLKENGEKWMKDTANSCMIVAALIATVVFAAAFTVPGGTKEESGTPQFVHEVSFKIFIISDAISLVLSVCSILTFLSILTSRYAEKDFLLVLPTKLVVGLSTLLLSIATMMVVFCATMFIVFKDGIIWVPILVSVIASLPVIVFTKQQWRLLLDVVISTYKISHLSDDKEETSKVDKLLDNDDEYGYYHSKYRLRSFLRRYYMHGQIFFQEAFCLL